MTVPSPAPPSEAATPARPRAAVRRADNAEHQSRSHRAHVIAEYWQRQIATRRSAAARQTRARRKRRSFVAQEDKTGRESRPKRGHQGKPPAFVVLAGPCQYPFEHKQNARRRHVAEFAQDPTRFEQS